MADLDDLGFTSISDMNTDEALDTLRQIRLSRRIPVKTTKVSNTKRQEKAVTKVSAEQAAEILKLISGDK